MFEPAWSWTLGAAVVLACSGYPFLVSSELIMSDETPDLKTRASFTASRALLSAALGGLLCFGTACSSGKSTRPAQASTGGTDGSASDGAFFVDGGLAYCINTPDVRAITLSRVVAMTEDEFKAQCSSRGGTFEIMPHCGGLNSCMGMSYDTGTQTLTEHSCKGLNSCAGYSCVICS